MIIVGNTVHVSGIGPLAPEATSHLAKVGTTEDKAAGIVGTEDGKKAARACAITMLSVLRTQLGSLNHIKRLVKATGFVNCTADFTEQPEVMNGFSVGRCDPTESTWRVSFFAFTRHARVVGIWRRFFGYKTEDTRLTGQNHVLNLTYDFQP